MSIFLVVTLLNITCLCSFYYKNYTNIYAFQTKISENKSKINYKNYSESKRSVYKPDNNYEQSEN